jgi:ABC-type transport system involved in multi-copper enzyme maturation permease subunit
MALLRKELRSLLRERRHWLVPVIYVGLLASVSLMFFDKASGSASRSNSLGESIASVVAVLQSLAVVLIAPVVGAAAIAGERERGTLSLLLASPVNRLAIAPAKALACTLYLAMLMAGSLPVAATALLFGGMDLSILAGLYLTNLVAASALVCVGIYVSTLFQRTWSASAVALSGVGGLTVVLLVLFSFVTHGRTDDLSVETSLMGFNPCGGLFLFFASSHLASGPRAWLRRPWP